MKTISDALILLGYRQMSPGNWGKPIGYQLFTYTEKTNLWDNWFKGANESIALWQSEIIPDDILLDLPKFLGTIKSFESSTRLVSCGYDSQFEFLSFDQRLEAIL